MRFSLLLLPPLLVIAKTFFVNHWTLQPTFRLDDNGMSWQEHSATVSWHQITAKKEARLVITDSRVFDSRLIRLDVELRNFRYFYVKQFSCHVRKLLRLVDHYASERAFTRNHLKRKQNMFYITKLLRWSLNSNVSKAARRMFTELLSNFNYEQIDCLCRMPGNSTQRLNRQCANQQQKRWPRLLLNSIFVVSN